MVRAVQTACQTGRLWNAQFVIRKWVSSRGHPSFAPPCAAPCTSPAQRHTLQMTPQLR